MMLESYTYPLFPDICKFQARIKKIMQADEDVGKIALAVPVLVCESHYHRSIIYLLQFGVV